MKNKTKTQKTTNEKIDQGNEITELVKGSLEYTQQQMADDFRGQFQVPSPYGGMWCPWYIVDTFVEYVVARGGEDLEPDEYFKIGYTFDAEQVQYNFDPADQWQVVELTYQPQTTATLQAEADAVAAMIEAKTAKKRGKRVVETIDGGVSFVEESGAADNVEGPWRVKAIGITADEVNGNGRRYSARELRAAVNRLKGHLHESNGQGRAASLVTGESDHPIAKGNRRPLLSETVINWDSVEFDGKHVALEGNLLGTSLGRDIRAQMRGGVIPGISQRAYCDSKTVRDGEQTVEEMFNIDIAGYDLTVPGEQSDPAGGVTHYENKNHEAGDEEMKLEDLIKMVGEHPEMFEGLIAGKVEEKMEALKKMSADQLKAVEESVRKALGLDEKADVGKALAEAAAAKKTLDETKHQSDIDAAIAETTKSLPYGEKMNKLFVESVQGAHPQDAAAVKSVVESKRKEYDALTAEAKLASMGFRGINVVGPVLESETGVPEFARGAHEFTEALVKRGMAERKDFRKPKTINEVMTALLLERYDKLNAGKLKAEAKLIEEAEQTGDLNLPYSVSRAIIAEAFPQLIAISVFDFGVTDQSPTRIYYENYANETGVEITITDEAVTADLDAWVAMDFKRIQPGTVVVTANGGSPTYVEGDDYVIDYANGQLKALTAGDIGDGDPLKVDYIYDAVRLGEMQPIERGKGQLSFKTLEIAADRLATEVSKEAVVFSRSQIGWDATTRTINMLINQVRRKIDTGILRLALSSALSVASNSGGTWTAASDALSVLVADIGLARVKIAKRFYEPTAVLMSTTMSDTLSNSDMFTAAGLRPDADLNAKGYIGRVKGLPAFDSTEFPDTHVLVVNRELVAHRVFQPLSLNGPFPSYSSNKLIASDQFYVEEFNGTDSPVAEKGAYVKIA